MAGPFCPIPYQVAVPNGESRAVSIGSFNRGVPASRGGGGEMMMNLIEVFGPMIEI